MSIIMQLQFLQSHVVNRDNFFLSHTFLFSGIYCFVVFAAAIFLLGFLCTFHYFNPNLLGKCLTLL